MNLIKKIWKRIKRLFAKPSPSAEKIISEQKEILAQAVKSEEIYSEIAGMDPEIDKEALVKKIASQEVARDILDYAEEKTFSEADSENARRVYELHELRDELQRLEEQKVRLQIAYSNISFAKYSEVLTSDERYKALSSIINSNKKGEKIELQTIPASSFEKAFSQFEALLSEKSTLKRFKAREADKVRQQKIYEDKIIKEINRLETLITESKYVEAKNLIKQLKVVIKPNYKKGVTRLARAVERLQQKELEVFKRLQQERLKLQAEKVEQLKREEEENKKAASKEVEFEFDQNGDDILDRHRVEYVFHMTEISNLKSILQHGLLSHNDAHRKGLNKKDIALQEVNQRRANKKPIHGISLHDYVPMYFNPKNPMLYKRKSLQDDIVILAIDRRVIYHDMSIFSDGNAASDSTKFYNSLADLSKLQWPCIKGEYWNDYPDGKRVKCAETLTHPMVPVKYVKKIHCRSIKTKNAVDELIADKELLKAELNSKYFFNR